MNLDEFYTTHVNSPKALIDKKLKEMFDAGLIVQERVPEANVNCPLVIAIQGGRAKIVSVLLRANANPNLLLPGRPHNPSNQPDWQTAEDRRPLHVAAIKGNPEIVRLLIEKGADVNAITSNTQVTPLMFAVRFQHGDVADILRAAGAKSSPIMSSRKTDPQPTATEARVEPMKPAAESDLKSKSK